MIKRVIVRGMMRTSEFEKGESINIRIIRIKIGRIVMKRKRSSRHDVII